MNVNDKIQEKNTWMKKLERVVRVIFAIVIVVTIFYAVNSHQKENPDYLIERDTGFALGESISFWGLSWFHRDYFKADYNNVTIGTNNFWGNKTITIPYPKIKEIEFERGLGYHSIKIIAEGGLLNTRYSFNVMNTSNLDQAAALLKTLAEEKIIIIKNNSILYSLIKK